MFKNLILNNEYSFDFDGSFIYKGDLYKNDNPINNSMQIEINDTIYTFSRKWLGLLAHYEVNLKISDVLKISFVKCLSRVIGLKCESLMIFKSSIKLDEEFYIVPGFTNFAISKKGIVKSVKYNRILNVNIGPYGYPYVNVYDADKSRWRSVSLHILLARTFIHNSDPENKFFVNHKDGDKENLILTNLEWVTSLENQRHAVDTGLRKDNKPCKVFDTVSKKVTVYQSLGIALGAIGLKVKNANLVSKINGKIVPALFIDRYEIKLLNDESEWFYSDEQNLKIRDRTLGPFEAKSLKDGKVFEAKTIKELSSIVGMSGSSIQDSLRSLNNKSTGGFLFRIKSDEDWPIVYHENVFIKPRKILLTNLETNQELVFLSIRQAIKFLGIDKRTLKHRLVTNKPYKEWEIKEVI